MPKQWGIVCQQCGMDAVSSPCGRCRRMSQTGHAPQSPAEARDQRKAEEKAKQDAKKKAEQEKAAKKKKAEEKDGGCLIRLAPGPVVFAIVLATLRRRR